MTLDRRVASFLICLSAMSSTWITAYADSLTTAGIPLLEPQQLSGNWYEIARLGYAAEQDWQQVSAQFTLLDGEHMQFSLHGFSDNDGLWHTATAQAQFIHPTAHAQRQGQWSLSFDHPDFSAWQQLTVLDIDKPYYNYALVCSDPQHVWILSRTPQLTYPIKQHLMAKAKGLGYTTDQLVFVKKANQVEYEAGRHVIPQHN